MNEIIRVFEVRKTFKMEEIKKERIVFEYDGKEWFSSLGEAQQLRQEQVEQILEKLKELNKVKI